MPLYEVHCFEVVRIIVTGIEADSHRDAIRKVKETTDGWWMNVSTALDNLTKHGPIGNVADIELTDEETTRYLVDVQGDEDFSDSRWFDGEGNDVTDDR